MKRLADICDIQYGYAFDSKCFTEDSSYPQLVRIREVKRGYSETYYSGNYPEEYILSEGDLLIGMDGEFNIHNDFDYAKYYITQEKYEDMIGFKVVPGDLIISCSGVTLGRIAEVPNGAKAGIINQALLKLSLNQELMMNTFFIQQFRGEEMSEEWLDFIIACRSGKSHTYDIVIGAMADDQIYNYVSDYMDGVITREQFWVLAKFRYPTHQIAFCTDIALQCLEYRNCEVF